MKVKMKEIRWSKRKTAILAISVLMLLILIIVIIAAGRKTSESFAYKETQVKYGRLTVGISESGAVDIGTVEQTFALDMSALQRVETGSSGSSSTGSGTAAGSTGIFGSMGTFSGMGNSGSTAGFSGMGSSAGTGSSGSKGTSGGTGSFGGMGSTAGAGSSGSGSSSGMGTPMGMGVLNLFSQMMGGSGALVGTGDASSLTIAKVLVSVGQQVAKGDALFELAGDSVADLEQELQNNVGKAKADLEAVYADQKLSQQTADYTYQSSLAYGTYAKAEYDNTMQGLKDAVESSQLMLARAESTLTDYQNRLQDITASWQDAAQVLSNCQYSLNHTDPDDVYQYVYYYNLAEQAKQTADSLEQQKEQLENNVEQAKSNVETAAKNYAAAQRSLAQGTLGAKQTYDLRALAYDTAQETYEVTLAYLEDDIATQEEIYQEAKEKWDEFSSYISGNAVLSQHNGIITSVALEAGDSINTGSLLVTLYDMSDVSMTVTVREADMADISIGSAANISFIAYPEQVFSAVVSEISDASTDSKGNVVYQVTVMIAGDVSGLFQGMTGDVTFVTEQSEEALYVSKRAVTVENGKSYVKIRQENGTIVKREVTTGFTDGTYIQITEGLAEGDIVLIESKIESKK